MSFSRKAADHLNAVDLSYFHPFNRQEAEEYIQKTTVNDMIIRPSSYGPQYLAITFKNAKNEISHLLILETTANTYAAIDTNTQTYNHTFFSIYDLAIYYQLLTPRTPTPETPEPDSLSTTPSTIILEDTDKSSIASPDTTEKNSPDEIQQSIRFTAFKLLTTNNIWSHKNLENTMKRLEEAYNESLASEEQNQPEMDATDQQTNTPSKP